MPEQIAITTSSFDQDILKPFMQEGLEFKCNPHGRTLKKEEMEEFLKDCPAVVAGTEPYDRMMLERLDGLKIISRVGVGTDAIDLDEANKRGVKVFTTPDGPVASVSELIIGLIFNLLRQISLMDRNIRNGQWTKIKGELFAGKTVGVIGFGRIGQAVAQKASQLGADVCFYDPFVEDNFEFALKVELDDLLKNTKIITIHVPYSQGTHNFINKAKFDIMRNDSYLINCARGGIVHEEDLHEALTNGKIKGAAMDVFEQEPYNGPLAQLDNVILTPHIGSYAKEARQEMERTAVENLFKGLNEVGLKLK